MTYVESVKKIAEGRNLTQRVVRNVIDDFVEIIVKELKAGNKFEILGLGALQVKERAPKVGRNPRTGETIEIPERKGVSFRCTKTLKDGLNA